jgi:hypothetical protein
VFLGAIQASRARQDSAGGPDPSRHPGLVETENSGLPDIGVAARSALQRALAMELDLLQKLVGADHGRVAL